MSAGIGTVLSFLWQILFFKTAVTLHVKTEHRVLVLGRKFTTTWKNPHEKNIKLPNSTRHE